MLPAPWTNALTTAATSACCVCVLALPLIRPEELDGLALLVSRRAARIGRRVQFLSLTCVTQLRVALISCAFGSLVFFLPCTAVVVNLVLTAQGFGGDMSSDGSARAALDAAPSLRDGNGSGARLTDPGSAGLTESLTVPPGQIQMPPIR